jgi:hypothetical protein
VKDLHATGYKLKECSRRLSVNAKTVRRDKKKLSLDTWPSLSDADLPAHVADIIALAHTALGSQKIGACLLRLWFRDQKQRAKAALVCTSFFFLRAPAEGALIKPLTTL